MKPLHESIKNLGGWPILYDGNQTKGWNETTFDWIDVLASMRSMGFWVNMFINFKIVPDVMNNTKNIIHVRKKNKNDENDENDENDAIKLI